MGSSLLAQAHDIIVWYDSFRNARRCHHGRLSGCQASATTLPATTLPATFDKGPVRYISIYVPVHFLLNHHTIHPLIIIWHKFFDIPTFPLNSMAWVRPKHPPPKKPKPDPVVTLLPMLSYFSGGRPPQPPSPTKPKPQPAPAAPLSRDPILRSLQQTQAAYHQDPSHSVPMPDESQSDHSKSPTHRNAPSRSPYKEEHHQLPSRPSRTVRDNREPSPPPPPPPPLDRPRLRPASYERHQPVQVVLERYSPRATDHPSYQERIASRATSARWANATAPLVIK